MAAWTILRLGDLPQASNYLGMLTTGRIAAVAFTECDAGSDLSAITTQVSRDGENILISGEKVWVTGARYADLLIVMGRLGGHDAAAVVVPTSADGVHIEPVRQPLGCRAAGHANVRLNKVRLPAASILGGCSYAVSVLITTALTFGRLSVAWGSLGILRGCLATASVHARKRHQFGKPIADHQLIRRHLAQLVTLERVSTQVCEHVTRNWDSNAPTVAFDAVLAKYVSSKAAAKGASTAVQILASAGAENGHLVARAYRDAKLMEIIEGSNEICELLLAEHALNPLSSRREYL
jgi:methoxymalonate biosynthesis protein